MNNLEMLWAYIRKQAPPGGIPGDDDREYRDLKQYYDKKVSIWAQSGTDTEKRRARDLVNDPLEVCKLKPDGKELCKQDGSNKLAVAANLLAMSIVLNIDTETLKKCKEIAEPRSISNLEASLKTILTKGDLVKSTRIPNLELKNFGSLPLSKGRRAQYIAAAENAYQGAKALLTTMNQKWSASSTGIPEQFKQTFRAYFGDPDAKVDVVKLGFQGGAPIVVVMFYRSLGSVLTGSQTRWALVRAVLNCVWQGLQTKTVRLYLGG